MKPRATTLAIFLGVVAVRLAYFGLTQITYEDSLTKPINNLEEIVNGESRIMPPATDKHAYLLHESSKMLERQLSRKYEVLGAEIGLGIRRSPVLTCRVPDRTVFRIETLRQDRAE